MSKENRVCPICGQVQDDDQAQICQRCGAPLNGSGLTPHKTWTWVRGVVIVLPLVLVLAWLLLWISGTDLSSSEQASAKTPTSPSAMVIPTSLPTLTPTEVPTVVPTVTEEPVPEPAKTCSPVAAGALADLWKKYQIELGCPLQERGTMGFYAEQPFEQGHMFWSEELDLYLVTIGVSEGKWYLFGESPWEEGMPEESCTVEAPEDLEQPVRGFGGIWCEYSTIREEIGFAIDKERGFEDGIDLLQAFEKGYIFRDSDGKANGLAYVMFEDGTFIRVEY